jgi:hypothetical protein
VILSVVPSSFFMIRLGVRLVEYCSKLEVWHNRHRLGPSIYRVVWE